jgi:hypothetical protein
MTTDDLARLIAQYRAGLDAEMVLLRQLAHVADRQHAVTRDGDFAVFHDAADERDRLMQGLVTIEAGLRDVRQQLTEHRDRASRLPGFDLVVALHKEAAALVNSILSTDRDSLSSLADAELARRSAVAGIERGETTLAAYRRVLTPPVASATLVNRRG